MKFKTHPHGFTLAELLISTTILALILTISVSVYINFFGSVRNVRAANLVYEEARFTMERIVKEIRNGTVDFEEYFNQRVNFADDGRLNETYGLNYCEYGRQFYGMGLDGLPGTLDDESLGLRLDSETSFAALESDFQKELYLINIDGTKRTYIKRLEQLVGGRTVGTLGMVKLTGHDYGIDHVSRETSFCPSGDATCDCPRDEGEQDGRIDTWLCEDGFDCEVQRQTIPMPGGGSCDAFTHLISNNSFIDITPPSLDIVSVDFIIDPTDDPRKAYNDVSVQIQPHVTIRLVARANARLTNEFRSDRTPDIVLESTVSARVYHEIITECNVLECLPESQRDCPRTLGVCGPPEGAEGNPAQQSCQQGVWPGCQTENYLDFADADMNYGLDDDTAFDEPRTFYESGSEIASCDAEDTACRERRCTDGLDNDCNGVADSEDAACLIYLCNNGIEDGTESCVDVGGICDFTHPLVRVEEACFDGLDNDCRNNADEFDPNCVAILCNNNQLNPAEDGPADARVRVAPFFALPDYEPKNYLLADEDSEAWPLLNNAESDLNEVCVDIGGLCETLHPSLASETGEACFDGLDNDCDTFADELDEDCLETICTNQQLDCGLVPTGFATPSLLTGYNDALCRLESDRDETCVDAGGLCGGTEEEVSDVLCFDRRDNDCNGRFDGNQGANSDLNCCPDRDEDTFAEISDTCEPPSALTAPPTGMIDCDDTNTAVSPEAVEICNDARYAPDYAVEELRDQPIDNNCSFANSVTPAGALDRFDPSCCVDTDGDGYGVPDAYIYFDNNVTAPDGTVLCGFSAALHRDGVESPDCNDTTPGINPEIVESGDLCRDGIDNNCNGLFDHIDFNPDNFDPICCNLAAIEICNDGGASDENCNGASGMADRYCMTADGRSFFDTFTSTDYRFVTDTTARWNADGVITIDPPAVAEQIATSALIPVNNVSPCVTVTSVTLMPVEETPAATDIEYEVSVDGGSVWQTALPSAPVDFPAGPTPTNDLRWRATLRGNGVDRVPTLNSLNIEFECD